MPFCQIRSISLRQGPVAGPAVNFLPFDEFIFLHGLAELLGERKKLVHAVPFLSARARLVAETENSNRGNRWSSSRTIVVLPEPLGAENITNLPIVCRRL